MTDKPDGGAAFPSEQGSDQFGCWNQTYDSGMSLRQYAAIKLRVPDSGLLWLDEMIEKSNRDWLAGMVLQGMNACLVDSSNWPTKDETTRVMAEAALTQTDAMLNARSK